MKTPSLPVKLTASILILGAMAAWGAIQTASFMPPPQTGDIFAVINADRSATGTRIGVAWGSARRSVIRGNQYGSCAGVMSGWVLLVRHTRPGSQLFTVSTTGTIARAPYQGIAPPEISHPCYKLEKMRISP